MKIKPLHDRIIIKRLERDCISLGGIVIPDSATEKPTEGKVIAIGNGKVNDAGELSAPDIKVGDKVLFGKYSGVEIKIDEGKVLVMCEDDIFAVITE